MLRPQTVVIFVPFVICADFLCDGYFYLFVFRYVPKSGPAKIMYRTAFWYLWKSLRRNPHKIIFFSVLRIREVSRIRIFFHPGSASKNLRSLDQNIVSTLLEIWSELFIPDPKSGSWFFYPSRIRNTAFPVLGGKLSWFFTSRTGILKLHLCFKQFIYCITF